MIEFHPVGDDGLKVELELNYSPERVFRAWSERDEFCAWFRGSEDGRLIVHDFDFREGGGFEVTMVSGSGHEATLSATYLSIVPNASLKFTWAWKTSEGSSPQMVVEVDIAPTTTGSRLTILHSPFQTTELRDQHQSGWSPCLQNLVRFLATASS